MLTSCETQDLRGFLPSGRVGGRRVLDAEQVRRIVIDAIGDSWDAPNAHGVDLREALVPPSLIKVIQQTVHEGEIHDTVIDAWLVLIENPESGDGYRIVANADGSDFGLAIQGSSKDAPLFLCGWYGDFVNTLEAM
jgi:hypothetical protein